MGKTLQIKGGTTDKVNDYTGSERELIVDTDKQQLVVQDGKTKGGIRVPSNLSVAVQDSIMSKAQFDALAAARREQFAGSGIIELARPNWSNNDGLGDLAFSKNYPNMIMSGTTDKPFSKYLIDGSIIKFGLVNNDIRSNIYFPTNTSTKVIVDSTKTPELKQADYVILSDLDRELLKDNDLTDRDVLRSHSNGLSADFGDGKVTYKSDGSSYFQYGYFDLENLIIGVEYEVNINVEANDDNIGWGFHDEKRYLPNFSFNSKHPLGDNVIKFKALTSKLKLYFNFPVDNDSSTITMKEFSIKQISESPLRVLHSIDKDIDLYSVNTLVRAVSAVGRRDFMFIEEWVENVSDKDFVYPNGNVQYRGNDVDGLNGITVGAFVGFETYSLFGQWQNTSEVIGKGYQWSKLSEDDKMRFAKNPDNNMIMDEDTIKQRRFRTRIVKGLDTDSFNNKDLLARYQYDVFTGTYIMAQSSRVTPYLNVDIYPYNNYQSVKDYGTFRVVGDGQHPYYSARLIKEPGLGAAGHGTGLISKALPLAAVTRRNDGIYDPILNPEGTARIYNDGAACMWHEVPKDLITSLVDCFNHDLIATVDKDDATNASRLSMLEDGTDDPDTYKVTGTIESNVSGREDGLYLDEINKRDVEDLRFHAEAKTPDEIRREFKSKAVNGYIRGTEREESFSSIKYWLSNDSKKNNKNGGVFIWKYDSSGRQYLNGVKVLTTEGVCKNNTVRYFDVVWFDINENILGMSNIKETSWSDQIHTNKPANTAGFMLFVRGGKSFNSYRMTAIDVIGDPRTVESRVKYITVSGDDQEQIVGKNLYVKADDNYYRSLVDRGSDAIVIDPDTEDYSNEDNWLNLGDNGNIGGYDYKWKNSKLLGRPLLTGEEGQNLLPISDDVNIGQDNRVFKISRKSIKPYSVLVRNKSGEYVKYSMLGGGGDHESLGYNTGLNEGNSNTLSMNIDSSYADLGYESIDEMLDLMTVIVVYETRTNGFIESNNNEVLSVGRIYSGSTGGYPEIFGNKLHYDLLGKVHVGSLGGSSSNIVNEANAQYAFNDKIDKFRPFNQSQILTPNVYDDIDTGSTVVFVKSLDYLTEYNSTAVLQFVYKEVKYAGSGDFGDNDKMQVVNKTIMSTDSNGKNIKIGQKSITVPYFIKK